ncbi:hypothetical protein ACOI1H_16005 [Loktanella sp. DJP18]|uniref:hypothetical protein n=1 Tax=Loktanella sp. DJP18 TaxID=3409788 RepID=UPI003BB5A4B0
MKTIFAASVFAILSTAAFAQQSPEYHPAMPGGSLDHVYDRSGFGVNVGASTLGFAIEPTWRFNNKFGVRAVYANGEASYDEASNGESYSGNLSVGGKGVMADYYPMEGSFFLSGGAFVTDNSASFVASNVNVNGKTTDITVRMDQKDDGLTPYLGMGFDGRIGKRGTLSIGAGGIFGEGFDVSATESAGTLTAAELDGEIADIRQAGNDFKVVPFAKIAVGFRF